MNPKVLFVYKRAGIDTAEIRGKQIAAELGCDTVRLADLSADKAAGYDIVVYVKRTPRREMIDAIRARGVKQVLDVLDNYSSWKLRGGAPFMDLLIAANITHAVHLKRAWQVPSIEIPHHHCNFGEERIPFRESVTLGFISTPRHWPENRRLAEQAGLPVASNVDRRGGDALRRLADSYLACDIGFMWRFESNKLRFNCANKLTNCMSFGIPSVLTPESGYLEYGRHGETVLYAYDKKDFVDLLKWLASDTVLRRRMGDACYEAARPFHIRRIREKYLEMFAQLV